MNKLSGHRTLIIMLLVFSGCKPPVQEQAVKEADPLSEQFIRANQYSRQRHQEQIAAFLERVGWGAEQSASGLWIAEIKAGDGKRITGDSRVSYAFECSLLDGTPCYSASAEHPKIIVLGREELESGVEQGLKKLSAGAEAIFLIPPHLAHGNFGDRDKIPGNSVLIYKVAVLKVD